MRILKFIGLSLLWLAAFFCVLWVAGALCFDFPIVRFGGTVALLLLLAVLVTVIFVRGQLLKLTAVFLCFIIVLSWWLTLRPSNNQEWQSDVAETAWATIDGDKVIVHNVRNCDYRTETDFTPQWDERTVSLSQISGFDLAITYWGSPWMAHPIAIFRFNDALPLCFSIETRKAAGQSYSAIRGLYRQFTLIYIASDERDVIRLRTNYRKGEEVYLYRVNIPLDEARGRFLEYIGTVNNLHVRPRWYNAVTTNCTTAIRAQHPTKERTPWDWRILVNGKADELLYERHLIATGDLSFPELKKRSHVNNRARAADKDPDFSKRIREGVPGFESVTLRP